MNPQTQIDILKLEKALAELEAQWLRRQDSFKVVGRGQDFIPKLDSTDVQLGFWIFACMTIICLYFMSFIGNGGLLSGILMLAIWGFDIFQTKNKAKFYEEQKAIYEAQKADLLAQIQNLKDTPQ